MEQPDKQDNRIRIMFADDHLLLQDNGVGFEQSSGNIGSTTATSSGLGILGMKERCKALGGELRILSTSGKGTVIQVSVPASARRRGRLC
jgi:signal transduction histidine kinase